MIVYSIIILSAFISAILIPVSVAVTNCESRNKECKGLNDDSTDTFFMRG
jgi:hypothetical protein